MNADYHHDILLLIRKKSGKPTKHTFLNKYLGNEHPRYPISSPVLRKIAKEWMRDHAELNTYDFSLLLTSLITGESSTEKFMAGILMDYSSTAQRKFDPLLFDQWLDHLIGWAEVDTVCTGDYTKTEILRQWKKWRSVLISFAKSKNINKRRASLVLLCSPLRNIKDDRLAEMAFRNIDKLKHEKEVLITKAISWVLRSMVKHYRQKLVAYIKLNSSSLPKIAVRETTVKLKTGVKNKKRQVTK